ncbi:MOSC domain-containing protein [Sporormia fimetaria CBS 119925]|uniref:MOSC domain-containing protein n=1 Tax=Sporormia fimetaria CBS 119925 TaxID=1340428 RepID=A0A6A6VHJ4_9PLEO|nr:MOSC domain-containing protein [Sporormia fimetaria CBS 119925]
MALPNNTVVLTALVLPLLTYLAFRWRFQNGKGKAEDLPAPTEITQLMIYPIKSCHGISVPRARLLPTGLDLDRHWMWVTYPDYKFLTIRNLAKMTLIRPTYDTEKDVLAVTAPSPKPGGQDLFFSISAHPSKAWLDANCQVVSATVWSTTTPSYCISPALTAPFDAFFGKEVRLVYKPPFSDSPRALASNGSKEILGRDASTCFPDLMPVLVGCENSIAELNGRLKDKEGIEIPIQRFRPNVIVKGHGAWSEDSWKTLRIAGNTGEEASVVLDVTQRCARCRVPNVDTETAEEHKTEPWDTLMKYRRVDEGIKWKPCFGMLCVPRGKGGVVEVGGRLEITEVTKEHRYVPGF